MFDDWRDFPRDRYRGLCTPQVREFHWGLTAGSAGNIGVCDVSSVNQLVSGWIGPRKGSSKGVGLANAKSDGVVSRISNRGLPLQCQLRVSIGLLSERVPLAQPAPLFY